MHKSEANYAVKVNVCTLAINYRPKVYPLAYSCYMPFLLTCCLCVSLVFSKATAHRFKAICQNLRLSSKT